MILLTPELREQLLANGHERDVDHFPVAKFFNPLGEGVWLATELDEDGDTLFGLAFIRRAGSWQSDGDGARGDGLSAAQE